MKFERLRKPRERLAVRISTFTKYYRNPEKVDQ